MIFHDVQQNTDPWYEVRLGKVTASNNGCFMAQAVSKKTGKASKNFGEAAKRYALQVALERIKRCRSSVRFSNDHTDRGHEQEPIARALYEEENFVEVTNGGFFDCGLFGDSPDGLVGSDGVLEIKSVIPPIHEATIERGKFDPAYKWQIAGHFDCTGREWVDFCSYCADFSEAWQLVTYRIYRTDFVQQIDELRDRRAMFIDREVEPRFRRYSQRDAA